MSATLPASPRRALDSSPSTVATDGLTSGPIEALWRPIPGELARLSFERSKAEAAMLAAAQAREKRADGDRDAALALAESRRVAEVEETAKTVAGLRSSARTRYEAEISALEVEHKERRKSVKSRFQRAVETAEKAHDAAKWEASTLFESSERATQEWHKEYRANLANHRVLLENLREEARLLTESYRRFKPLEEVPPVVRPDLIPPGEDPFPALQGEIEGVDYLLEKLHTQRFVRFFRGLGISWAFLLPGLLIAYPAWYLFGPIGAAIAVVAAGAGIGLFLRSLIMKRGRALVAEIREPLVSGLAWCEHLTKRGDNYIIETCRNRITLATDRRDSEMQKADAARAQGVAEFTRLRDTKLAQAAEKAEQKRQEAVATRDIKLEEAAETERVRGEEIAKRFETATRAAHEAHRAAREQSDAKRRADHEKISYDWSMGLSHANETLSEVGRRLGSTFPLWTESPLPAWIPPTGPPEALRFGTYRLATSDLPGGISSDESLRSMAPDHFSIPAIMPFPGRSSIIFEAGTDDGRKAAIEAMQAVMLRFLTGLPPGKVRFTIIDPVGLGRHFAGFMHLADFAESLVNTRIWTEPTQIDARLGELNAHVESVTQNFLRNEYPTIEDYNLHAGEVAEPYRVLVVADFPAGFSEATARRLAAIAQSGPRCGVHLILGRDTRTALPPNITRGDFELHATRLVWRESRFVPVGTEYEAVPLEIDRPPAPDSFTRLLQEVGRAAKAANRVEVPFEVIAPKEGQYWQGDSRHGVDVPLGRSGATKLQSIMLGKGTSQHVLIAGRTGSGKSTLLHALITNSALIYSPDELELYLIDFKKGVEFKTYATQELPHARVVAIESEREFGLSVLQRLDGELKLRGDRYRDLGVQDVAGYRTVTGKPLPRILLIVDEFQEFFVEDDKLAQEASLLLDRLVRQGRAFGVHVHLGSQTLSGAYSLARSTLGQMAVRIALQCSESDAQLILNEDNSAARLLSRPGEAIYNDANGQVEGNHTFQVVWLPDSRREVYLKKIAALAKERGFVPKPRVVFEGDAPSDLTRHPSLIGPRPGSKTPQRVPTAALGEAVAIKDPTAAAFRAQGGSNLLIIGQNDELALGLTVSLILGLASGASLSSRFYVIDGTPDDSPGYGTLGRFLHALPQSKEMGGIRETGTILSQVAALVEERQAAGSNENEPVFVLIYDLQRFRDLRKSDDDFGFSRRGENRPVNPSKLLGTILRDGPALGVHLIVWCDSLNNANRSFDRQTLREFELRVLFQMSSADSSNLIDSPSASRLGPNRAYFSSEEAGRLEKFRPYGLPSPEWLADLSERWKGEKPRAEEAERTE